MRGFLIPVYCKGILYHKYVKQPVLKCGRYIFGHNNTINVTLGFISVDIY